MRAGAKARRRSEGFTGSDPELLFVYGTLRSGGSAAARMGPARLLAAASYRGRLYDLGRYPGVVPSADPADLVRGELFVLPSAAAPLLAELDRYEGPEFRRVPALVTPDTEGSVESWIYLYTGEVRGLRRVASGDYLA
jgi:gamma-glutamylcyclotransferase (GGCT)/AIG2-like uncharacterized protein YtfP